MKRILKWIVFYILYILVLAAGSVGIGIYGSKLLEWLDLD